VIFLVNLDDFFAMVCMDFHEVVVCTRYVPIFEMSYLGKMSYKH